MDCLGNKELLKLPKTAFLASSKIPVDLVLSCYDWASQMTKEGNCVISGFSSHLEKEVLHFLMKGRCPIILVLAREMYKQIPQELQTLLDDNRLLIISTTNAVRQSRATAHARNRQICEMAHSICRCYGKQQPVPVSDRVQEKDPGNMKQGNGKTKIIINMGITIDMKSNQPSPRSKGKSLSAALKELKSEENWTPSVASAFAEVGILSPDELTPSRLLSLLTKNKKKDKKTGKVVIGVWVERKVKDFDGFYVRKFDGTYQTERVLRKVGSWTKNTLLRVLAQNGIVLDTQETGIMEESNADIIDINSSKQKLRDQRTYTEPAVKRILYSFARDLGCKWSKQKLEAFVETAFDFD